MDSIEQRNTICRLRREQGPVRIRCPARNADVVDHVAYILSVAADGVYSVDHCVTTGPPQEPNETQPSPTQLPSLVRMLLDDTRAFVRVCMRVAFQRSNSTRAVLCLLMAMTRVAPIFACVNSRDRVVDRRCLYVLPSKSGMMEQPVDMFLMIDLLIKPRRLETYPSAHPARQARSLTCSD